MATYNVYSKANIAYDFSTPSTAYLSNTGLCDTLSPQDPVKLFSYTPTAALAAASIVMFSQGGSLGVIHTQIFDENGVLIPGTERMVYEGPCVKSTYTFDAPVNQKISYGFSFSGFPETKLCIGYNATITYPA